MDPPSRRAPGRASRGAPAHRATNVMSRATYEATMRALLPVLMLVVLLGVPLGQAGSEARPEINDRPNDAFYNREARRDLDVLRVWLQRDGNRLQASMSLGVLASFEPNAKYVFFFSTPAGRQWLGLEVSPERELRWQSGLYQGNPDTGPCPEAVDPYLMSPPLRRDVTGDYDFGQPGYVRVKVALKDIGLATGDPVRSLFVLSYVDEGQCNRLADITGQGSVWTVPKKPNVIQRVLPGFELLAVLGGAAAALALQRRKE